MDVEGQINEWKKKYGKLGEKSGYIEETSS